MNVYLVDDEPLAVQRLERMLVATGRVTVVGSSSDPEAAVAVLNANPPDALFLDIEMPVLNGFELLARLDFEPLVVFTTAYDRYALRAFEVNSADYLLKPIEPQALDRALAKLTRMVQAASPRPALKDLIAELGQHFRGGQPQYLTRIASRTADRIEFVDCASVTHFYAQDKVTFAATPGRHYIVDHTITALEERLDPREFLRIHRSTIVALRAIQELHSWFGGRLAARLKDGKTELAVARDRVAIVRHRLGF